MVVAVIAVTGVTVFVATKWLLPRMVKKAFVEKHYGRLKEETIHILDSLGCAHTQAASLSLAAKIKELPNLTSEFLKTEDVDLGWKKTGDGWSDWESTGLKPIVRPITDKLSIKTLQEDDMSGFDFDAFSKKEKVGKVMRSDLLFPLKDSAIYLPEAEESADLLEDLGLLDVFPQTYNKGFTMDTNESFSRIFFNGMACPLIAAQETVSDSEFGPFVADMPLHDLPARPLYKPYGARVHFGEDQLVSAIYDYVDEKLYKPGDEGWTEAKMHAKSTAFVLCTVREHLMWTHFTVANDAVRESTVELPPSHPIRRLLQIFTFRTNEINLGAFNSLVPEKSLLHRGLAFEYSGIQAAFEFAYNTSVAYQPFPERKINPALQKLVDQGKFPYVSEGVAYYEIVRTFVGDWLSNAGDEASDEYAVNFYTAMQTASEGQKYELPDLETPDAMVNVLSTIIWTVTAFHELIGYVSDYTCTPFRVAGRICKKGNGPQDQPDVQAFLTAIMISCMTSLRVPQLMTDFPDYIGAGGAPAWERDAWNSFQAALKVQSKKVQEADSKRLGHKEFKHFDPSQFECSVSV